MFWFPLVSVRHQWSPQAVVSTGATDVMSSWHITGFRDIVTLRRITQCCHNGRALDYLWVLITDGRRWESWIWCDHLSAGAADAMRLLQCSVHGSLPHDQPHGVLASCVLNSRIFPWFIYFLSPLFWNLNAADTRINRSPMIHLSESWETRASRQAGPGYSSE